MKEEIRMNQFLHGWKTYIDTWIEIKMLVEGKKDLYSSMIPE